MGTATGAALGGVVHYFPALGGGAGRDGGGVGDDGGSPSVPSGLEPVNVASLSDVLNDPLPDPGLAGQGADPGAAGPGADLGAAGQGADPGAAGHGADAGGAGTGADPGAAGTGADPSAAGPGAAGHGTDPAAVGQEADPGAADHGEDAGAAATGADPGAAGTGADPAAAGQEADPNVVTEGTESARSSAGAWARNVWRVAKRGIDENQRTAKVDYDPDTFLRPAGTVAPNAVKNALIAGPASSPVAVPIAPLPTPGGKTAPVPNFPPPPPPVLLTQIGGGTFTVQPGDTLWQIAQERLGNPDLFPLIEAANPQVGANDLVSPGQVLRIPQIPAPPPGSSAVVVQPGGTLWAIAGGNEALIQKIAEINQIRDPSLIFVGQALIIPPG
jgi:nucleoid-associated protein YgaU